MIIAEDIINNVLRKEKEMKILLTTLNSKYIHTALSLQYLYTSTRSEFEGIKIEEFTINHNRDYILGEIYKGKYDIVCFSCYIWNIKYTLEIINDLKKINPNAIIVLGGPEVSFKPENIIKAYASIDYIVVGEGEVTFKELLHYLINEEGKISDIDGIVYRQEDEVIRNKNRSLIKDLDSIASPYEGSLEDFENKIIYYESSRGCPHNCKYCLSSTIKGVRFFSLDRVKHDLDRFLRNRVKQVKFVDRTFNAKKSHCLGIMKYLAEKDNGYTNFHFEITADLLDDEILQFLSTVREGLFQFEVGVQTTYDQTMKSIDRHVDFNILSKTIKEISSFKNIHLHLDLIAGLPFENYERFKKSFDDVYNLKPEKVQLGFLKLLKGSAIRSERHEHEYIFQSDPPYEVMENKYLNYGEVLKLKTIEEMVEIYYNSQSFNHTIDFVIDNFFNTPSEFFEKISNYWEEKGYHHISHGKNGIYKILLEFLETLAKDSHDIMYDLLKYDYLSQGKSSLPDFLRTTPKTIEQNKVHEFLQNNENIRRYLPRYEGVPVKQIIKRVHFENFSFNVLEAQTNNTVESFTTLLFDYDMDSKVFSKSKVHEVNLEGGI